MTPTEIQRAFVLIVVMAGGAMALLDIAVVNVALPSIMVAVGANVVEVRWVVTAFMLCSALVMPITGWMGRRIGYGNLYIASLAFFTAGFPAQKLLVVPKETPDRIVFAYEDAVRAMKQDPDYRARKPAALGVYEQVTGDAAQKIYELATDVPQSARDWVRTWLRDEFRVKLEG